MSAHELLAAFADQPNASSHDAVESYWQSAPDTGAELRPDLADHAARRGRRQGLPGVRRSRRARAGRSGSPPAAAPDAAGSLEIVFRPDPSVVRRALRQQRLADGAAAPVDQADLGQRRPGQSSDRAAARPGQPGCASSCATPGRVGPRAGLGAAWPGRRRPSGSRLGYGRRRGAGAGNGVGFDAYALRTASAPVVRRRPRRRQHRRPRTRWPARRVTTTWKAATWSRARRRISSRQRRPPIDQPSASNRLRRLYPAYAYPGNAWGMVIDQSACVGCNACIVACQAENNIPVVGKEEVGRGREMHWLRVDTYYEGAAAEPAGSSSSSCRACSARTRRASSSARWAPPPTAARASTTWSTTAASARAIARTTVRTRSATSTSSNTATSARRASKLLRNPEVTVRSRGVMEKCTYCVQRISAARIQAERENRPIARRRGADRLPGRVSRRTPSSSAT